ncbi:hypothetical protein TanjilG_22970 [Lupinus angustifolius]|uniref:VOC domain-containing protein n=1 Tax=Lupinus angustifolius TaxID=3871 RepID=A0A1J7IEA8_LUPAN|nr:hypothetical protein TanjilG_22970 [Lupinus angustifolius]
MAGWGVSLNHISRESSDLRRLANFYKEIFGFEEVESPKFGEFKVIWLKLPSTSLYLHIIERNPNNNLPEGPYSATSPVADTKHIPRGHHLCFSLSNLHSFLHTLKVFLFLLPLLIIHLLDWNSNGVVVNLMQEKGIETFERALPDGKIKQVFFFDPDGNGLEVASQEDP